MNKETWGKEFDKNCYKYDKDGGFIVWEYDYDVDDFDTELIKLFISGILKKQEKEHNDCIDELVLQHNSVMDRTLKEIRDDVVGKDEYDDPSCINEFVMGYNRKRKEVIETFNKYIK